MFKIARFFALRRVCQVSEVPKCSEIIFFHQTRFWSKMQKPMFLNKNKMDIAQHLLKLGTGVIKGTLPD